jgi:hypothetical protein
MSNLYPFDFALKCTDKLDPVSLQNLKEELKNQDINIFQHECQKSTILFLRIQNYQKLLETSELLKFEKKLINPVTYPAHHDKLQKYLQVKKSPKFDRRISEMEQYTPFVLSRREEFVQGNSSLNVTFEQVFTSAE